MKNWQRKRERKREGTIESKFIWGINQVKCLCTKTKFKMQDNTLR